MGLDQYAYALREDGETLEIARWRKHPNLHGWMERLWVKKGRPVPEDSEAAGDVGLGVFNCIPLELDEGDIEALSSDLENNALPHTEGFFFGQSQPEELSTDELFVRRARGNFGLGNRVFYDSWW